MPLGNRNKHNKLEFKYYSFFGIVIQQKSNNVNSCHCIALCTNLVYIL